MTVDYQRNRKKAFVIMKKMYDMAMALFLLGMAFVMFFADKMNIEQVYTIDVTFRYLFGGICLLYGSFRLYRGIKPTIY